MAAQGSLNETNETLSMECSTDELSPIQLIMNEGKSRRFNEVSRVFNTLRENGELVYENTFFSIILLSNYSSSSECSQILPDDRKMCNSHELYDGISQLETSSYRNCNNSQSLNIRFPQEHLQGAVDMNQEKNASLLSFIRGQQQKRTHPSLLVKAVPGEVFVQVSNEIKNREILYLNKNIEKVLSYDAEKFTEWLLKRGLLHTLQFCKIHGISEKSRLKVKQYLFKNKLQFFNSGGYVWESDCCPNRYFSIFKGTLFEGVCYPSSVLILLYHWSCQTNVNIIIESLGISENQLRTFYTYLRGICIAALHEDCKNLLGGKNKMVEVGFYNLRVETSNNGRKGIWFIGVLDCETKFIKLYVLKKSTKSINPRPCENKNLLLFLTDLIDKKSTILTDLQLHKHFFTAIGFKNVYQRPIKDQLRRTIYSNENIMAYLTNHLPQMFENNLGDLTRPLIQQHLDELCWREKWGVTSLKAFNSMINYIRKQINLCCNASFTSILSKISRFPFINWQYSRWKINIQKLEKCHKTTTVTKSRKNILSSLPTRTARNTNSQNLTVANKEFHSLAMEAIVNQELHDLAVDYLPVDPELSTNTFTTNTKDNPSVQTLSSNNYEPITIESAAKTETTTSKSLNKLTASNYKPMPNELIPLECYYYGTIPGKRIALDSERKESLDTKCILCGFSLKTNICLMKHIMKHAFSSQDDRSVNDTLWCKYCLKLCLTYQRLRQTPINTNDLNCVNNHFKSTLPGATCLICEKDFKFRTKLIVHMHSVHDEMELPYECGVCNFRSSQHHVTVDHFYKTHNHSDTGQCPLCLKVVTFKDDNGFIIIQNVHYFLNHMRKHTRKDLVTKCDRCVLSFVDDRVYKYHKATHHTSCKHVLNIVRWSSSVMMMPVPPYRNYEKDINPSGINLSKTCIYSELNIEIQLTESYKNALCFECDKRLIGERHLFGDFSCLVCSFKTCCNKSMFEHTMNFHYHSCKPERNKNILLNDPMRCLCGFKSVFGNKLAEHLVRCGKITVYKSEQS